MNRKIALIVIKTIPVFLCLILITACTPGKAHTKQSPQSDRPGQEEMVFEDEFNFTSPPASPVVKSSTVSDSNFYAYDSQAKDNRSFAPPAPAQRENFYETGKASWYGREFQGKQTASGEDFNMYDMTAAHKTLPFGSIVEVKNLDTGKSVKVRINDRGPYRGGRIIDLSYNAAANLGMVKQGEANVGINILEEGQDAGTQTAKTPAPPQTRSVASPVFGFEYEETPGDNSFQSPAPSYGRGYMVQAGAFYSNRNADNLKHRIQGFTNHRVNVVREGDFFKVRVEGISSRHEAESFRRTLSDRNISSYIIQP